MKTPPRSPAGHLLSALPYPLEVGWFLQDFGYHIFPLAGGFTVADATTDKGDLRRMCAPYPRAPVAIAHDDGSFTVAPDTFPEFPLAFVQKELKR